MRKLLALLVSALLAVSPVYAANNAVVLTPGSGVTLRSIDIGAGVQSLMQILGDSTGTAIYGTAGAANANVLTVQGIASGTALAVSVASGAVASGAYASGSIASGAMVDMGSQADSAAAGDTSTASLIALLKRNNQNLTTINTSLGSATPAGTNQIGFVGLQANTTGGCIPGVTLSAASNNSTNIKNAAGTLCSLTVIQTTTTLGDLRLYDSASAPTCSSATGVVANYAVQSNATSPGFTINLGPFGMNFANGIGFCLTGAVANNDNTNFVTGVQVNYSTK